MIAKPKELIAIKLVGSTMRPGMEVVYTGHSSRKHYIVTDLRKDERGHYAFILSHDANKHFILDESQFDMLEPVETPA